VVCHGEEGNEEEVNEEGGGGRVCESKEGKKEREKERDGGCGEDMNECWDSKQLCASECAT